MLLGIETDPCIIWAWGLDSGGFWKQAKITGQPDERWQWITINKGAKNGFKRGLFLDILRRSRKIGRAEVDIAGEKFSVAWILKGTMGIEDQPRLGDEVRIII